MLVAVALEADQRTSQGFQLDPAVPLPVDGDAQPLLKLGGLRGPQPDVEQAVQRSLAPIDVDVEVFLESFGDILPLQRIDLLAAPRVRLGRTRVRGRGPGGGPRAAG